jgi:hypothetical protein
LPETLARLKSLSIANNGGSPSLPAELSASSAWSADSDSASTGRVAAAAAADEDEDESAGRGRFERSLGILAQRFVMLFLANNVCSRSFIHLFVLLFVHASRLNHLLCFFFSSAADRAS